MATEKELVHQLLKTLREKLGTGEHPPGSNHNFITEWYNKHVEKIGNGPWCQMTNTWSMWVSGFKSLYNGRAYTVWAAQDGQNKIDGSSWHWGTKGMKKGDHVYYDWSGKKHDVNGVDHTGTVEKIVGDGTFYALEGNAGDKLVRTHRDGKFVVGYVRSAWGRLATAEHPHHEETKKTTEKKPAKKTAHHKPEPTPIEQIQTAVGLTGKDVDGKWGPITDRAVLIFRKKHLIR